MEKGIPEAWSCSLARALWCKPETVPEHCIKTELPRSSDQNDSITVYLLCGIIHRMLKGYGGKRLHTCKYVTGYGKTRHMDLRAMRVFSTSGQNLWKCTFCHTHLKEPFFCYCRLQRLAVSYKDKKQRLAVSYKGKISLHFDLPSLYSCRTQSPLLRAIIRIPARGLSRYS